MTGDRTALVVAHPGHELRVHGWLETVRPRTTVLTDGSGSQGTSRLDATARVLERAGASRAAPFGTYRDREVYDNMLAGRVEVFTGLAQRLADDFVKNDIRCVVADGADGYNPTHDLCRYVVNAAVRRAAAVGPSVIRNLAFSLVGEPSRPLPAAAGPVEVVRLDAAALDRKLAAARDYAELRREVEAALEGGQADAYGTEYLWPVSADLSLSLNGRPYYETYGEQQVAAGQYRQVLRLREHFLPIVEALAAFASDGTR
jgi:hypothetical protein